MFFFDPTDNTLCFNTESNGQGKVKTTVIGGSTQPNGSVALSTVGSFTWGLPYIAVCNGGVVYAAHLSKVGETTLDTVPNGAMRVVGNELQVAIGKEWWGTNTAMLTITTSGTYAGGFAITATGAGFQASGNYIRQAVRTTGGTVTVNVNNALAKSNEPNLGPSRTFSFTASPGKSQQYNISMDFVLQVSATVCAEYGKGTGGSTYSGAVLISTVDTSVSWGGGSGNDKATALGLVQIMHSGKPEYATAQTLQVTSIEVDGVKISPGGEVLIETPGFKSIIIGYKLGGSSNTTSDFRNLSAGYYTFGAEAQVRTQSSIIDAGSSGSVTLNTEALIVYTQNGPIPRLCLRSTVQVTEYYYYNNTTSSSN